MNEIDCLRAEIADLRDTVRREKAENRELRQGLLEVAYDVSNLKERFSFKAIKRVLHKAYPYIMFVICTVVLWETLKYLIC